MMLRSAASIASVVLAACASTPPPPPADAPAPAASAAPAAAPGQVDGATAHKLVADGAVLVDVRSPDEFATKHLDGAVNIPVEDLASKDVGAKDKPMVLYCTHGRRSAQAAETLRGRGYTRVYLLGPMSAWGP